MQRMRPASWIRPAASVLLLTFCTFLVTAQSISSAKPDANGAAQAEA